jgi:hypothetical protein
MVWGDRMCTLDVHIGWISGNLQHGKKWPKQNCYPMSLTHNRNTGNKPEYCVQNGHGINHLLDLGYRVINSGPEIWNISVNTFSSYGL